MGNIFVNENEEITITIWHGTDINTKKTRYWSRKEDEPANIENKKNNTIVFRKPNFRDTTTLIDLGIKMNIQGGMDLAFSEIRYKRLEMLLKKWDITDDNGKPVSPNEKSISSLNPVFAVMLATCLERELGVFDEMNQMEQELEENSEKSVPSD